MIKQNKNLFVSHLDKITSECLNISRIWYQYYEPYELDYLTSIGFDRQWMLKNFVEELPNEEMDIQYTIKDHQLLNREFTYIGCKILISDESKLNGYAFKINDEVNAITAFLNNTEFNFYNPSVFAEENSKTMQLLTSKLGQSSPPLKNIKLEYGVRVRKFFKLKQEFRIC